MFTGIVTDIGVIESVKDHGASLRRIRVHASYDAKTIAMGASIACSGPCLTVVGFGPRDEGGCWFEIDAAAETLARTTVGAWQVGTKLNLERALKIGDELGGHLVSGHVDGVAEVLSAVPENASVRWRFRLPPGLSRFVAEKGSIAIDGVSLTVNEVDGDVFGVNIIPHTAAVTTFATLQPGGRVNIEIDTLARYVARLVSADQGAPALPYAR